MSQLNQLLPWIAVVVGFLFFGISATEASSSGRINCLQTPKENALAVFKQCKQETQVGCKKLLVEIHQSNTRRCGFMSGKRSDVSTSNSIAFPVQRPLQNNLVDSSRMQGERSRPWLTILHRLAWSQFLERYNKGTPRQLNNSRSSVIEPSYDVEYDDTIYWEFYHSGNLNDGLANWV